MVHSTIQTLPLIFHRDCKCTEMKRCFLSLIQTGGNDGLRIHTHIHKYLKTVMKFSTCVRRVIPAFCGGSCRDVEAPSFCFKLSIFFYLLLLAGRQLGDTSLFFVMALMLKWWLQIACRHTLEDNGTELPFCTSWQTFSSGFQNSIFA
jgi:hypothetical protein